jgi:Ca-activated chloride channel family protein
LMETLAQFHFIRPIWLLLALPAFVLWWFWRKNEDPLRGWREQIEPELLDALVTDHDPNSQSSAAWLLIAWLLGVLAIAGPTWQPEPNPFAEDASPLVVLLKADVTMQQEDPAPSRMERARLKIADLAAARKGQLLGLIAYAGSAHLVLPPTKDTDVVAQMAAEIAPEIMPEPGDRLDLALTKAGQLLAEQDSTGSVLVVADAADGDVDALAEAHQQTGKPAVFFLAVNTAGSSEDESLRQAARAIGAQVEPLAVDGSDIETIVKAAARPPVSRADAEATGTRWQEEGWLLVPILATLVALGFRREITTLE